MTESGRSHTPWYASQHPRRNVKMPEEDVFTFSSVLSWNYHSEWFQVWCNVMSNTSASFHPSYVRTALPELQWNLHLSLNNYRIWTGTRPGRDRLSEAVGWAGRLGVGTAGSGFWSGGWWAVGRAGVRETQRQSGTRPSHHPRLLLPPPT